MVRRHGWQLPAHKFQVIAITIFFLLVIVFYAFFAPFLGSHVLEYVSVCLYTPVALAVFILYVRCTAINPADPGLISRQNGSRRLDSNTELPNNLVGNRIQTSPSEVSRSSMGSTVNQKASMDKDGTQDLPLDSPNSKTTSCLSAVLCAVFVKEDCKKSEPSGEEALFCILCNVEVQKFSKHCRSCDKCVDGFDHHCRWLNNCVGRKNYMSFISLMAISLIWLAIQLGVGIAVFVRIFVDRKETEVLIIDKLGNVFSRAPFATIVAISCAVSLLACVPLGELFFFHIILMKKGITTYEYVVAMRAMSEGPAQSIEEEIGNAAHSPSGSATTGFSVGSSLALSYKGGWCTPPRVFIDDQDEIIPHLDPGMVPSTIDPDVAGSSGNKLPKRPVRISAWKLAKLNSVEAIRAGAKARASSSVLRPIDTHRVQDSDLLSNGSSVSVDIISNRDRKSESRASPVRNSYPASHASKDDHELGMMSMSSLSSPSHIQEHVSLSPLPPEHSSVPYNVPVATSHWNHFLPDRHVSSKGYFPSMSHNNPIFQTRSRYDGDRIVESSRTSELPVTATQPTSVFKEAKRSVVWDQEAGRYVSVPVTSRIETPPSSQKPYGKPPSETNYCNRRHIPTVPIPSTSSKPSTQKHENLTYTEQSIFFGGPLLSIPSRSEGNNPPRSGPESRPTFTRSFLTNPPPDSK